MRKMYINVGFIFFSIFQFQLKREIRVECVYMCAFVKRTDSERVCFDWSARGVSISIQSTHWCLNTAIVARILWYPPIFIVKMLCYRIFILTLFTQWLFYCWCCRCFCKHFRPADSRNNLIHSRAISEFD